MPSWGDLFNWLIDCFINIINALSHGLYLFVSLIISAFPTAVNPPSFPALPDSVTLNAICWFFPVGGILSSISFWASSATIYFSIKCFLRWI